MPLIWMRGFSIRVPDATVARALANADPHLPRTVDHARRLAERMFPLGNNLQTLLDYEECSEIPLNRLMTGAGFPDPQVPGLVDAKTAAIQSRILMWSSGMPLVDSEESDHFVFRWPASGRPTILPHVMDALESGWTRLGQMTGREPRLPAAPLDPERAAVLADTRLTAAERTAIRETRFDKIEVWFCELGRSRGDTLPDGPIRFNLRELSDGRDKGQVRAVAVHELFHRFQYSFGFRTTGTPAATPYAWISEGTACLAELLLEDTVSAPEKITTWFSSPGLSLLNSSYYSVPYWHETSSGVKELLRLLGNLGTNARTRTGPVANRLEKFRKFANARNFGPKVSEFRGKEVALQAPAVRYTPGTVISGYGPPCSAHYYWLEGRPRRVRVINGIAGLDARFEGNMLCVTVGPESSQRFDLRLEDGSVEVGLEAPRRYRRLSASAGSRTLRIDNLGNIWVESPVHPAIVLGFEVDGVSSLSRYSLQQGSSHRFLEAAGALASPGGVVSNNLRVDPAGGLDVPWDSVYRSASFRGFDVLAGTRLDPAPSGPWTLKLVSLSDSRNDSEQRLFDIDGPDEPEREWGGDSDGSLGSLRLPQILMGRVTGTAVAAGGYLIQSVVVDGPECLVSFGLR